MTNTTIGMSNPKRYRQLKVSMIQPDKVGPIAGARPITKPPIPRAFPRSIYG